MGRKHNRRRRDPLRVLLQLAARHDDPEEAAEVAQQFAGGA
jgi:hypothetical protein